MNDETPTSAASCEHPRWERVPAQPPYKRCTTCGEEHDYPDPYGPAEALEGRY